MHGAASFIYELMPSLLNWYPYHSLIHMGVHDVYEKTSKSLLVCVESTVITGIQTDRATLYWLLDIRCSSSDEEGSTRQINGL